VRLAQHPDEHRPERPVFFAVDQQLASSVVRNTCEVVEIQVRTPLIFPDNREAIAVFLRRLGYEPSTESLNEEPGFSLEDASEPRLTPREKEVLRLMPKGHTYWEITEMLRLGSGVVAAHGEGIMKKLQHRRPEVAHWYIPEDGRTFVLWLAGTVGTAAADELARAVAEWIQEHVPMRGWGGTVRIIYGPDDKALAEVPIEADDADE
jgi:DNA-binding CsgD family transcriptional regulator